jgi:hypothetical protein
MASLSFYTIGSMVAGIPPKFGNRLELANYQDGSKSIVALRQSVSELSETYEFEELKVVTPQPPATPLAMTTGNPVILISTLLATIQGNANYPQFQNQNIVDLTDIYTFWMWFAAGVNQAGRTLDYRRIPTVDQDSFGITSSVQGMVGLAPPTYYSRFGQILQVGPVPDNPYQYFVRMKIRHPFPFNAPLVPATLIPTVAGGGITAVTVNAGGSGYLPSLTNIPMYFSTPVGGMAATGTATSNSSGVITGVAVATGGSGYNSGNAFCGTAAVASQPVFAPDSWTENFEYAACWRIATWEGAVEYIEMFDNVLKSKGVDLAKAREAKSQMIRDEKHNSRALSLRLGSPYTFA